MNKQETYNNVIRAQMCAQLTLEYLEKLHDGLGWKQEAKKFGNMAINCGDKMIGLLTSDLSVKESQSYIDCCDYVRQRVEEINLEIFGAS